MSQIKKPFSELVANDAAGISLEEAQAEAQRELDVRRRIYDRWVAEGKLAWVDARDRIMRQAAIVLALTGNHPTIEMHEVAQ